MFTYAVDQFKAELPRFLALFVEGVKSEVALALNVTVSVVASPNVVFPLTVKSKSTIKLSSVFKVSLVERYRLTLFASVPIVIPTFAVASDNCKVFFP